MCLLGYRAVRHSSCLETSHDRIYALYLIYRDSLLRILEIHKTSQIDWLKLLIDKLGVFLEGSIISVSCGKLEKMDCLRVVEVLLLAASELMAACTVKGGIRLKSKGVISSVMICIDIILDILKCDSTHTAHRIGKIFVHNALVNTDCLKDFGALI